MRRLRADVEEELRRLEHLFVFGVDHPLTAHIRYVYSEPMTPPDLRRLRRRLGVSQARFAALVGVTSNTVARWERGELGMRPTTDRLIRLVAKDPHRKAKLKKET